MTQTSSHWNNVCFFSLPNPSQKKGVQVLHPGVNQKASMKHLWYLPRLWVLVGHLSVEAKIREIQGLSVDGPRTWRPRPPGLVEHPPSIMICINDWSLKKFEQHLEANFRSMICIMICINDLSQWLIFVCVFLIYSASCNPAGLSGNPEMRGSAATTISVPTPAAPPAPGKIMKDLRFCFPIFSYFFPFFPSLTFWWFYSNFHENAWVTHSILMRKASLKSVAKTHRFCAYEFAACGWSRNTNVDVINSCHYHSKTPPQKKVGTPWIYPP